MNITPDDKLLIRAFIENGAMVAAVLKVLVPDDEDVALGVPDNDDAAYGRAVRVWVGARDLVRQRFGDLKRLASSNPQPSVANEAR